MKKNAPRIVVSAVAALSILARLIWPSVHIDGVMLGLLALGGIPWLSSVFRSIEVVGIGKIEMREIERRLDRNEGAIESNSVKTDAALVGSTGAARLSDGDKALDELEDVAQRYNSLRKAVATGTSRTSALTDLIGRAIELSSVIDDAGLDIPARLGAKDGGHRVVGYAAAYARPDPRLAADLVTALVNEEQPFGQYWALLALRRVLALVPDSNQFSDIRDKLSSLLRLYQPGTGRHYELERLLKELGS